LKPLDGMPAFRSAILVVSFANILNYVVVEKEGARTHLEGLAFK
jgi:hypothetical protein